LQLFKILDLVQGLTEADFESPDNIVQLGYEPQRIDILTELDGVDFEKCYEQKSQVVLENVTIDFINAADLIVVKRKAGRLQDRADAQQIEKILKKKAASAKNKK
jgi:predicted nucleotidyltransferase